MISCASAENQQTEVHSETEGSLYSLDIHSLRRITTNYYDNTEFEIKFIKLNTVMFSMVYKNLTEPLYY